MRLRISRAAGLGAALAALPLFAFSAAAQLAVSSNDNKAVLVNGVNTVPENPAEDTVTVVDLSASPPKVVGEVEAPSSVVGPPQNVAITPDEGLALVSSNQKLDPGRPEEPRRRQPALGHRPQGEPAAPSSRRSSQASRPRASA